MGELWDKIRAKGYGAANVATAGNADDIFPRILQALPFDDGTGIPREYASGSAANDYRNEYKADQEDLARRYPRNFGDGGVLMGAVQAVPALTLGPAASTAGGVAHGAASGWGNSENTGKERVKDAVRGAALSGALGAAGNAAGAAIPAAKAAMGRLRQGPPPAAAVAQEAAPVARAAPMPKPELGGAQVTKMAPPRSPPRPNTAALDEVMPSSGSLAEEEKFAQRAIEGRTSSPPPTPDKLPRPGKIPQFDEADLAETEKRLRQTEESWAKRHAARFSPENQQVKATATVRPAKRAKPAAQAPAEKPAGLALVPKEAPPPVATRPELTAANKPLVGPKQLSDDRILELARQTNPEPRVPQGAKGLTPEQLESGKQMLRDEFKKTAGGGNVVSLDDGAIQAADDPFTAGIVREYQQHAKAAEAAGDPDQAEWFKNKIEELLTGS